MKLRNKQVPFLEMKPNTLALVTPVAIEPSPSPKIKGNVIRARLHYLGEYTGSMPADETFTAMIREGQATEILLPGNKAVMEGLTKDGDGKTVDPSPAVCVFKQKKDIGGGQTFNQWEIYGL